MVIVEIFWFLNLLPIYRDRIHILGYKVYNAILGDLSEVVRPDPIPNSVVKHFSGDDNISARLCENTSLPGFLAENVVYLNYVCP